MVDHGVSSQGVLLQSFCILLVVILMILTQSLALTLTLTLMLTLVLTLVKHNSALPYFIREIRKCLLILLGTS